MLLDNLAAAKECETSAAALVTITAEHNAESVGYIGVIIF